MSNKPDKFYKAIGVPEGHYCYKVIDVIWDETSKYIIGHKLQYCPFWYGSRPDGGCMVYGWDAALGDACKSCGWLEPDELHEMDGYG